MHYMVAARVTIRKDRQFKYNVTLRQFRATIVAVVKQYALPMVRLCLQPYVYYIMRSLVICTPYPIFCGW